MRISSGNLILSVCLLAWPLLPLRAQVVADGATNTLSNVTNTFTGDVTVGTNGSFTLLVLSDNALLTNSANGVIGLNATAKSNEVRLVSASARWRMGGSLFVGSNGAMNRLVVSNGAFVDNDSGTLGNRIDSSNNFALITGVGSIWSNRSDLRVGTGGRGNQLLVSNGGWVASRSGFVGNNATGSNNFALVTGSGSVWSNASDLRVGLLGSSNRLVIEAGGLAHCDGGTVGSSTSASNNEALVTGPGSRWNNASSLTIGSTAGRNRLVVSNGATVWSGTGLMGGISTASSNQVVVTGAGSTWSNLTSLLLGGASAGNRVDVSDGGWLACNDGSVGSVFTANSNSVVLSGGGSGWNNLGGLTVGDGGNGNVLIASNGATVLSSNATIGVLGSSANNNLALITGAGSLWSNRNDLVVGNSGVGNQLVVSNGGTVSAGNVFVGLNSLSASNRVTVDGGTLRATNITGTGMLDVRRGTNVLNAGFVEVDQLLVTNAAGRFEFNGGTLSARSTIVNNGQPFRVGNTVSPASFNLIGNGSHSFPNGLTVSAFATLLGNGAVSGPVTVQAAGVLAPGASIGKIILSNTPSLQGNLRMEVSKGAAVLTNDQIEVAGVLALLTITYGGSLTVTNIGTNALATGDRFQLFNAATYNGSFLTISLPPLNSGLSWINKLLVDGSIEVFGLTVQTLPASALGTATPTLNGVANPAGHAATAWFEWGATTNYGNVTVPQLLGSGTNDTNFSQVLTGLVGSVTYHFRAVASNSFGVVFGSNQSFTLPPFYDISAGLPGVCYFFNNVNVSNFASGLAIWGDYDNDGRLDILFTGRSATGVVSQIWRNTASGFSNINAALAFRLASSAAWGDYDNDGRLDILCAGEDGTFGFPLSPADVWRNTANGFTNVNPTGLFSGELDGIHSGAVAWGDYDNDGRLDIAQAGVRLNFEGGRLVLDVSRNYGSGFARPAGFGPNINADFPGSMEGSVAWGDYDGDGRLDILVTGGTNEFFTPSSQVWRNTGSKFTNINAGLPGVLLGSAAWGDYDNDGRLDILLAGTTNGLGHICQVWRNTGTGFTNINAGLPGIIYGSAAWGDYDNDGRLDILLTGTTNGFSSGAISQIWRNTGNGFTNINAGLPGLAGGSVAWGDYDNDGRLDVLLAGTTNDATVAVSQIWRNQTPFTNTPPTAPIGLSVTINSSATNLGFTVILSWNAATDAQTPASGLTYNVRIGTTPGGPEGMGPMASSTGFRRLPQMGNAKERLFARFNAAPATAYFWSVQAVDTAFAGGPFAPEQSFTINSVFTPTNGVPVPGDQNGDGIVSESELAAVLTNLNGNGIVNQSELDLILSNYFPNSPFLYMTNVAGLGGTNVTFALSNSFAGAFSVEYSTNLVDWYFLGPATPRYLFTDTNAPAIPQRYYRLRWP